MLKLSGKILKIPVDSPLGAPVRMGSSDKRRS